MATLVVAGCGSTADGDDQRRGAGYDGGIDHLGGGIERTVRRAPRPTARPPPQRRPNHDSGGDADQTPTPAVDAGAAVEIVSLSPTATEMLFAIGAGDQVVAVDQYSDYPAEVLQKPHDLSGYNRTSRRSPSSSPTSW